MLQGRLVPWSRFFVLQELDAQVDQLRDELRLAHTLGPTDAALDVPRAEARRRAAWLQEMLDTRLAQRRAATEGLPPTLLLHYDRLRGRLLVRPWVVWISDDACPACHVRLPTKLAADARRTREPVPCPRCQRVLIWRDP